MSTLPDIHACATRAGRGAGMFVCVALKALRATSNSRGPGRCVSISSPIRYAANAKRRYYYPGQGSLAIGHATGLNLAATFTVTVWHFGDIFNLPRTLGTRCTCGRLRVGMSAHAAPVPTCTVLRPVMYHKPDARPARFWRVGGDMVYSLPECARCPHKEMRRWVRELLLKPCSLYYSP